MRKQDPHQDKLATVVSNENPDEDDRTVIDLLRSAATSADFSDAAFRELAVLLLR